MSPPSKRRLKPSEQCQYGDKCYRKNPQHFMEYSHAHLDNILSSAVNNDYKIPDHLDTNVILDQLKILNNLYPNEKTPKKVATKANAVAGTSADGPRTRSMSTNGLDNDNDNDMDMDTSASPESNSMESYAGPSQNVQENQGELQLENQTENMQGASASWPGKYPPHPRGIYKYIKVVLPRGKMAQKLAKAAPYNIFLTTISSSTPTHKEPLSVTFQEILDPSLGEIESSVQINFMVDIGWLLAQYFFAGCMDKPLLLIHGVQTSELQTISEKKPQVTVCYMQMNLFATHHTKIMLLAYKDGSMRVVVMTANLYEDDWENRTQGVWISPRLKQMPDDLDTAAGESRTEFRSDLLRYLTAYKLSHLQPWITRIRKTDFRLVNVFLVTSVPGTYTDGAPHTHQHGHVRMRTLLTKHSAAIDDSIPIVAQSSSLGSFGSNASQWLLGEFARSFRCDSQPQGLRQVPRVKIVYPSLNNVLGSHDGLLGGGCLPYSSVIHCKQPWLTAHLYQWKADARHRTQAMPHVKSYARWTHNKLYWFLLTSANLSKAAWGTYYKSANLRTSLRIANYEVGVLFLPQFILGTDHFPMENLDTTLPPFPTLYDVPLKPYDCEDIPFLSEELGNVERLKHD